MKTIAKITGLFLGLLIVLAIGVFAYFYAFTHTSAVNFQQYQPPQLPNGATITNKTVEVWSNRNNPFKYTKQLTLDLNAGNSYINETNAKSAPKIMCFPLNVINDTCSTQYSAKHQFYLLETTLNDTTNKPFDQTVRFVKDQTYIWMTWQDNGTTFGQAYWGKIVDSFQPVSYSKAAIKHYSPGP